MDEKPKSIWKKSFTGWLALLIWLVVAMVALLLASFIVALLNYSGPAAGGLLIAVFLITTCLILIYVVWPLTRLLCWQHWRRTLFALVCFATLVALFYAEEDWRGKHDWKKFKREREAKGEHFDYASVIPPPVPDDQNFALTPIVASCYEMVLDKNGKHISPPNTNVVNRLEINIWSSDGDWKNWPTNGYWVRQTITDLRGWQQYYRALAAKTNEFPIPAQPQSPAQDVLLALSKYDSIIEELRQASQLPYSRFPLNYDAEHPFATLLPHLAAMKRCSQVLQLRVLAELEAGEADTALADVKLSLRLVESIRSEPFLISELVRIAMTEIMVQPIYEGLADRRWSDAQLAALDAELAKLDFLADYQAVMRGGQAGDIALVEHFRKHRNYQESSAISSGSLDDNPGATTEANKLLYKAGFFLMPDGWFYESELKIAQVQQEWITGAVVPENHVVRVEKYDEADKKATALSQQPNRPWNFFTKALLPALGAAAKKSAREQISVDLARTAIALERHRLAHGEFPASLDALAPQLLEKIPHDVIGGEPLKYRRTEDGQFILYSVGWNETDDGGVMGHRKESGAPDFESGDWVWRYPVR